MTHGEVLQAFPALMALRTQRMSAAASWDLYEMIGKCTKIVEFQSDEEKKVSAEMGTAPDKDGMIQFKNKADYDRFVKKMDQAHALTADIGDEIMIDLDDPANRGITISPEQMDQLRGLVAFRKGGKDHVRG